MSDIDAQWPSPRLGPSGALTLRGEARGVGPGRLAQAFSEGAGAGLLCLAARELTTALPEPLAFWRQLGRALLGALASSPGLESSPPDALLAALAPDVPALAALAEAAPPFDGAEYLSVAALAALWEQTREAARREATGFATGAAFLAERAPVWARLGRVSFHLADNPRDDRSPFAFMASFTHRVSDHGAVQHLPLLRALELYGASGDRPRLLRLLEPLDRAARASSAVARMVETNTVYRPHALTAAEAYALLRDAPAIEAAGVTVRTPDWWRARPRPVVRTQLGGKAPGSIGAAGLLDFSVAVALDGQPLDDDEVKLLLGAGEGLVRLRGRWVEANGAQLQQALGHWREVETLSRQGVSFGEAMRLLVGFDGDARQLAPVDEPVRAWSRVEPGAWLADELTRMRDPGRLAARTTALGPLGDELRPYQRTGVEWLTHLGALGLGACLADDMGLGKTRQVLGALVLRRADHPDEAHLVVAPASLLPGWRAEAARVAPSLRVLTAHPSARGDEAVHDDTPLAGALVLTTYGMLSRLPWLAERTWGLVVLDEAQAIKNASSRQSRQARSLKAAARVAVTGTPVENRPGELWPLFDFLQPGLLGPARAFGTFLREAPRREGALGRLRGLVRPYLLRRLKSEVATELPPKIDLDDWCLLTRRQAALYQAEVKRLGELLDRPDDIARKGAVLAAMTRLKQLCVHPSLLSGDNVFDPDDSGKFGRLIELADEIAQRQEKTLVFTQFRELTGPLLALLTRVFGVPGLCLHGGTPVPARRQMVEAFQRDDGPPFFVISLRAGGVGLTLTQASHVIHVDRWWNPAVEDQATDRAHRLGQTRSVMVHRLMCRGTLDERIATMLHDKRAVVADLLEGPAETLLTELPPDELLRLVALDLSAVAEG